MRLDTIHFDASSAQQQQQQYGADRISFFSHGNNATQMGSDVVQRWL